MSKAQKSPCYTCDIWKKWGSPDYLMHCPGPQQCKKHQQYLRKIGPAGVGGAPVRTMDIAQDEKPMVTSNHVEKPEAIEKKPIAVLKTKTCSRKQCKHSGKPQPLTNFGKNKREKDGHQVWCKICQSEYVKDKAKKDKIAKSKKIDTKICSNPKCKHSGEPQSPGNFYKKKDKADGLSSWCKDCHRSMRNESYQTKRLEKIKLATDDQILEQLFAGHEDLLTQLNELAAAEFRTPRSQLLYMVASWASLKGMFLNRMALTPTTTCD